MNDFPDLSFSIFFSALVVFLRVGGVVAMLPAFGERTIPVRVRFSIALAFTFVVLPNVSEEADAIQATFQMIIAVLVPEIITGLFFGLLLRFFVFALQITGTIIAQSTSLSQIFGSSVGVDPQPAIGNILTVGGVALAVLMGIHVDFAKYMIITYTLVPIGLLIDPSITAGIGLSAIKHIFSLAFVLAAPFVFASLLYNIILGVINRAMPQLMVSFIGAPAITAGGVLLLSTSIPFVLEYWLVAMENMMRNPGESFR